MSPIVIALKCAARTEQQPARSVGAARKTQRLQARLRASIGQTRRVAMAAPVTAARAIAVCATAAAPMLSGCADGSSSQAPKASSVAQPHPVASVAHELAEAGAESAIVAVSEHGHDTIGTAGSSRPRADQRFRIGSVTKVFTATIILQLVDDRKLDLHDTLDKFLPGIVPAGARITIRHLLDHRSGLANYTEDDAWLRRQRRLKRPLQSLRLAASRPLNFAPGTEWGYSNTNYVALGLIIEKITGRSYAHQLQHRILKPLGLRHTQLATTRHLPDLHDEGVNPNAPWAAGSIVSNAADLARFLSALLSGDIVSPAALTQMKQTVPAEAGLRDGLGIFSTSTRCGIAWGHDGKILDYSTWVQATPDGGRVAVVATRQPQINYPPIDSDNYVSRLLCRDHAATG